MTTTRRETVTGVSDAHHPRVVVNAGRASASASAAPVAQDAHEHRLTSPLLTLSGVTPSTTVRLDSVILDVEDIPHPAQSVELSSPKYVQLPASPTQVPEHAAVVSESKVPRSQMDYSRLLSDDESDPTEIVDGKEMKYPVRRTKELQPRQECGCPETRFHRHMEPPQDIYIPSALQPYLSNSSSSYNASSSSSAYSLASFMTASSSSSAYSLGSFASTTAAGLSPPNSPVVGGPSDPTLPIRPMPHYARQMKIGEDGKWYRADMHLPELEKARHDYLDNIAPFEVDMSPTPPLRNIPPDEPDLQNGRYEPAIPTAPELTFDDYHYVAEQEARTMKHKVDVPGDNKTPFSQYEYCRMPPEGYTPPADTKKSRKRIVDGEPKPQDFSVTIPPIFIYERDEVNMIPVVLFLPVFLLWDRTMCARLMSVCVLYVIAATFIIQRRSANLFRSWNLGLPAWLCHRCGFHSIIPGSRASSVFSSEGGTICNTHGSRTQTFQYRNVVRDELLGPPNLGIDTRCSSASQSRCTRENPQYFESKWESYLSGSHSRFRHAVMMWALVNTALLFASAVLYKYHFIDHDAYNGWMTCDGWWWYVQIVCQSIMAFSALAALTQIGVETRGGPVEDEPERRNQVSAVLFHELEHTFNDLLLTENLEKQMLSYSHRLNCVNLNYAKENTIPLTVKLAFRFIEQQKQQRTSPVFQNRPLVMPYEPILPGIVMDILKPGRELLSSSF